MAIREMRYRLDTYILGGGSVILTAAICIIMYGGPESTIIGSRNYGTMLLGGSIGAYVLAAVTAFMAGAMITAERMRKR